MLPMALFKNRNFAGASLSIVLLSFSAGGVILALTQYLQFVLGYEPIKAGLAFIPMLVTAMLFNGVGVVIDKKLGTRTALAAGLLLLGAGFGVLASIGPEDGYLKLAIAMVVMGMGSGTAGPAAYGTLLGALPQERVGVGSAVNDTIQQVGTALSVAVLGSVLTASYRSSMPTDVVAEARNSIGDALRIAAETADAALAQVARTAFVDAISLTSLIGVFGGIAAAIVAVSVLRPKPPSPTPGSGEPAAAEQAAREAATIEG
jgi:Na+/melibiose symporter-like transporter